MKHMPTLWLVCLALLPALVFSAGDPTRRATRLEPLLIDANNGFSTGHYALESGVYYRWRIQGDGRDDYKLVVPQLFENAWVERVIIEDVELKVTGLLEVTLESEAEVDIYFIPVRPGTYVFFIEQLRSMGFEGEIVVR